jgi:hypothetical protein
MPIPLGILAVAGAGGGAGVPAYELIATTSGTGSSGTITFSSIPSTYKHLELRWTGRSTGSGTIDLRTTFNGATNVYARHELLGNGSSVVSQSSTANTTWIDIASSIPGSNHIANVYAVGVMSLLDYAVTTKQKTLRHLLGRASIISDFSNMINLNSGLYNSTSAVSSITMLLGVGNWTTQSRFSLYGIVG